MSVSRTNSHTFSITYYQERYPPTHKKVSKLAHKAQALSQEQRRQLFKPRETSIYLLLHDYQRLTFSGPSDALSKQNIIDLVRALTQLNHATNRIKALRFVASQYSPGDPEIEKLPEECRGAGEQLVKALCVVKNTTYNGISAVGMFEEKIQNIQQAAQKILESLPAVPSSP